MNSKFLLGISIVIIITVIGAISVSLLIYQDGINDVAVIESSNRHDKDTKTIEELIAMTCEQIIKENIQGLQYFTKEGGDYIEEKVLECLKNEIPIEDSHLLSKREIKEAEIKFMEEQKLAILQELEQLETNSCDEIIQRNTEGVYLSSENRKVAREKVSICGDKQESPIRYGHCSTILIIAKTHHNFYTDDPKHDLINRIHDCIIDNEFSLSDVWLSYQIQMCNLYQEIENIPACNDIRITSQPFSESIPTDELYPILVENERKEINSIECSELVKKYDGKMHTISWNVHHEFISNAMDKCKDNSSMIGN